MDCGGKRLTALALECAGSTALSLCGDGSATEKTKRCQAIALQTSKASQSAVACLRQAKRGRQAASPCRRAPYRKTLSTSDVLLFDASLWAGPFPAPESRGIIALRGQTSRLNRTSGGRTGRLKTGAPAVRVSAARTPDCIRPARTAGLAKGLQVGPSLNTPSIILRHWTFLSAAWRGCGSDL